ncbi:MAG TPA: glycerophosphodiester phosphodiesterase family protein [Solirubrobacteraceae bacterium]
MHRLLTTLALALTLALPAATASAAQPCPELPQPDRWESPATPDSGRPDIVTAAHRGAAELAPENTLDAYRYAIAYGVDLIEVDVQQTLDGRYVSFHDPEVDAKTDGTGRIGLMSYEQARALNVAANDKWSGTEYDPARMPSLEEVLALADQTGVGIYVDMKESVTDVAGMMRVFAAYPEVSARSAFLPYEPGRAALITAVAPQAELMWSNLDPRFPASSLYALGQRYTWFGSDLETYDAGKVAAVHDACGLVIPNVYDGAKADVEAANLAAARAMGADGAQINLPDVTADALDEPVATRIERPAGEACLVDAEHGIGLPRKPLLVGKMRLVTDRDGCVPVTMRKGRVRFAGDGSALPSSAT